MLYKNLNTTINKLDKIDRETLKMLVDQREREREREREFKK